MEVSRSISETFLPSCVERATKPSIQVSPEPAASDDEEAAHLRDLAAAVDDGEDAFFRAIAAAEEDAGETEFLGNMAEAVAEEHELAGEVRQSSPCQQC